MADPVNIGLPVISGLVSGKPIVGRRLTCSTGQWSNNPTAFAYQWRHCNSDGSSPVDIGGATANGYTPVSGDTDLFLDCDVDATNTPSSTTPPAFTPDRTVNVTNLSQLNAAIADLEAGDLVDCTGTFAGQVQISKVLADFAVFDFTSAVFPGSSSAAVGLYFVNSQNIRTIGGEFTNPGGDGIRVEPSTNIEIYTPIVHDVGSQGILVQGNGGQNINISLFAPECYACGDISKDSHTANPGTGLHCIYFGGALSPSSGQIVEANLHDQPYGCGIELGANARNVTVIDPVIVNMDGGSYGDAGGNAFNLWGDGNWQVLIDGATGSGISGNVVAESMGGPNGAITMQNCAFTSVTRSPAYQTASQITYINCT